MNKIGLLIITTIPLLAAFPLPVHAEEESAKYNFASAQGGSEIRVTPGGEEYGDIYFYNIDGNRITHITLEVSQAPKDWEVTISPPTSETEVLVNEMPVTVVENLYIEPTELLSEEPETVPEGLVSIRVPGRGYTLGKLAQIVVRVPDSASVGDTGQITVTAEASWLGQTGSAAVKQARDFDFSVTVVSDSSEFTEVVVDGDETAETGTTAGLSGRWWAVIIAVIAVAIVSGVVTARRRAARDRANRG